MENDILKAIEDIYRRPIAYGIKAGFGVMPRHLETRLPFHRVHIYRLLNQLVEQGKLVKVGGQYKRRGYIPTMLLNGSGKPLS